MSGQVTPGPWREGIEGNNRVYGPDCSGLDSGLIAVVYKGRANVKAVAAVPEMLRLLGSIPTAPSTFDEYDRFASYYKDWRAEAKRLLESLA